jgi:hypothetical protein
MTLTILAIFGAIIFLTEFPNWCVYGNIIKYSYLNKCLDTQIKLGASLYPYDNSILYIGELPFISTHFSFISRYYINETGRVLRFTKADKRIREIHLELKGTRQDQIKKKLKIN